MKFQKSLLSLKNIKDWFSFSEISKTSWYFKHTERSKRLKYKIIYSNETYININGIYNAENILGVAHLSRPKFVKKIVMVDAFCVKSLNLIFFKIG